MNNPIPICCFILLYILAACSRNNALDREVLIPDLVHFEESGEKDSLSSLFEGIRLVQLETNDSCLVDPNGKIIRHDSVYYVQSSNEILMFDLSGHFIHALSKVGYGPGEYAELYDYNVVTREDSTEIWISSAGGIFIYDSQTLAFKQHISIDGFVNQFYYVDDHTIITVKPEDIIFKIYDVEGNLRKEFGKKDLANSTHSIAQFMEYEGLVLYHWDKTQEVVVYNPSRDSLYFANLFPLQSHMLTSDVNQRYYERYGYMEQVTEVAKNYITMPILRTYEDEAVLVLSYPDRHQDLILYKDGKTIVHNLSSKSNLENDLVFTTTLRFLNTVVASMSDQGFLFRIGIERYPDGEAVEEENPLLLDVDGINL